MYPISYPFSSSIFHNAYELSKLETQFLGQACNSLHLEDQIPSLREHSYVNKKRSLIELAERGVKFSKEIKPEDLIKICNPAREGRILSPQIGVYKKERSIYTEALVWEVSVLLGCDHWICPSLPIHIHGSEATFQPYHEIVNPQRFIVQDSALPFKKI